MTDTTAEQATTTDPKRAEFTAGLRALADFIDAHPDLPLPAGAAVSPWLGRASDEAKHAEVDRIAAILDVEPRYASGGQHYQVSRRFGAGCGVVAYEATAISARAVAEWDALTSYRDAVTP